MALLFIDGFDDGLSLTKWSFVSNTTFIAGGRTLNKAHLADNSDSVLRKTVANADYNATFIVGFAFKVGTSYTACSMLQFWSDAVTTQHLAIGVNNNNAITVYRGVCGTLLGTTANNVITPGVFSYVEVSATLSDTVGAVEVRVDGITVLSLTNIDTKNGGTNTLFETVSFQASSGPGGTDFDLDDFYLCNAAGAVNNTFRGDCSVRTLFPDGNGFYSQGVNSNADSVNNFSYVDENPPSAVDYVDFLATGDKDTYAFTGLPAGVVYGVQQASYAAKTDAGSRSLLNVQRIGGADFSAPGGTQALSVSPTFAAKYDMLQVSPASGVLWTVAEVNGAEFGVEAGA